MGDGDRLGRVKPGPFGPRVLVRFESDPAQTDFFSVFMDVLDGMNMIGMMHGSFGRGLPRRSYLVGPTPSPTCFFYIWSRVLLDDRTEPLAHALMCPL